jgi:hypothetical protein
VWVVGTQRGIRINKKCKEAKRGRKGSGLMGAQRGQGWFTSVACFPHAGTVETQKLETHNNKSTSVYCSFPGNVSLQWVHCCQHHDHCYAMIGAYV